MKITIVSTTFPPYLLGGGEMNAYFLANYLHKQGVDVEVVTGGPLIPQTPYPIKYSPALLIRPNLIYEPWWARETAKYLESEIGKDRIVHCFDFLSRAAVAEARFKHKIATLQDVSAYCGAVNGLLANGLICVNCSPVTLPYHSLISRAPIWEKPFRLFRYAAAIGYRKKILERFNAITTLTHFLKDFLDLPNAYVISDILEAPHNQSVPMTGDRLATILVAGRVDFDKGTDLVLHALRSLEKFLAVFVGKGNLTKWRTMAKALGVENKVDFKGFIEPHYMGQYYQTSDVVVLASRLPEASSRAVLEAFKFGKAVVAPAFAGPAELIQHEQNGILFERGNVESLVQAITLAYRKRNYLSAAAKLSISKYSPDIVGPRYIELYEKLLSS